MGFLFAKKSTISNKEERIGALRIQSSSQGEPIPIVYGMTRITGNLIWYGDFTAIEKTESSTSGGKGGGGVTTTNTTYTYTVGVAFGLSEGPIIGIGTIWSNKDIVTAEDLDLTEFLGTYPQTPWTFLTTNHPDEALAYQGTSYMANAAFNLGDSASLPNVSFEVKGFLYSNPCEPDANVGEITEDLLDNSFYGSGFPSSKVASWSDFISYCDAAGWRASPAYKEQQTAAQIIDELALIGNTGLVWSEGLLKAIPYCDGNVSRIPMVLSEGTCVPGTPLTYSPDNQIQYYLDYDDFIVPPEEDPVKVQRKRQADAYNMIQVECLDRNNDYNTAVVEAKDQWNIDQYGLRPAPSVQLNAICDLEVARNVAQTLLQKALYIRNTYEFVVGWPYARLEPMDIIAITDENLRLINFPVRIKEIEETEDGELRIVADEFTSDLLVVDQYATQDSSGYVVNLNSNPGDTNEPVIFQPPIDLSGVPQIWIGASGGTNWGGCQVWVSVDGGSSYGQVGQLAGPSRYGELTANFPATPDPDTTSTLSVDLTISRGELVSASTTVADALDTLSYVDGELIAYSQATLTGAYNYNLDSYIRRGQKCTFISPHLTGSKFMRLDETIGKFLVTAAWVGTTIKVKLPAFNTVGSGLQALEDVSPFDYLVQPIGITIVNGTVPSVIQSTQVLCIAHDAQYSLLGRLTLLGRINCDGRLIIS